MQKKSKAYYLGNLLILFSILGLLYTFWPIASEEWNYRFGRPQTDIITGDFGLVIPSLKIYSPIIADVDPFNESEYTKALQKGVAQAEGTVTPDQDGMMYLFAHSSEAPWLMTRQNSAFYRLPKINIGDQIRLTYMAKEYLYQVTDKKVVWPNQLGYLKQSGKNELILQTCYPVGTDWQRLLVFAEPVTSLELNHPGDL